MIVHSEYAHQLLRDAEEKGPTIPVQQQQVIVLGALVHAVLAVAEELEKGRAA